VVRYIKAYREALATRRPLNLDYWIIPRYHPRIPHKVIQFYDRRIGRFVSLKAGLFARRAMHRRNTILRIMEAHPELTFKLARARLKHMDELWDMGYIEEAKEWALEIFYA